MSTSATTTVPLPFPGGVQGYTQQSDGTYAMDVKSSGSGTTADQVQGNVASGATDSGNPVKVGGVYNSSPPVLTSGQRGDLQVDTRGNVGIAIRDPNGTAGASVAVPSDARSNSQNCLFTLGFNTIYNGSTWDRTSKASAASRIVSSANSNNATSAKASAGTVYNISGYNSNAAVRYLKLYNKASAPTVGTDTPILTLPLPPTAPFNFPFATGMYFGTGIAYGMVTGSADADNTSVGAADILGLNITYS